MLNAIPANAGMERATLVWEAGALEHVIGAMQRHLDVPEVQERGMWYAVRARAFSIRFIRARISALFGL